MVVTGVCPGTKSVCHENSHPLSVLRDEVKKVNLKGDAALSEPFQIKGQGTCVCQIFLGCEGKGCSEGMNSASQTSMIQQDSFVSVLGVKSSSAQG